MKFSVQVMEIEHEIIIKGVLMKNIVENPLRVNPNDYQRAVSNSKIKLFFQESKYFNAQKNPLDTTRYFDYQLLIERVI